MRTPHHHVRCRKPPRGRCGTKGLAGLSTRASTFIAISLPFSYIARPPVLHCPYLVNYLVTLPDAAHHWTADPPFLTSLTLTKLTRIGRSKNVLNSKYIWILFQTAIHTSSILFDAATFLSRPNERNGGNLGGGHF